MSASKSGVAAALLLLVVGADCTKAPQRPAVADVRERPQTEVHAGEQAAHGSRQAQPASARYDLGTLPEAFDEVAWPAPPRIERGVEVEGGERVIDRSGTRVVVTGPTERIVVRADDVEIRGADDARVGHVYIERGHSRIRIAGGRFGTIELAVPAQHVPPPPVWRPSWMVEDVTIDGVEVDAANTAFLVRGRRIAILRSRVQAVNYSVWCGDTDDFQTEDLVIAGNHFVSSGPESTVRLVSVRRAVVVDNVLSNTLKHDFRVHGVSDQVVFARNRLLNTGIMVGSMEGDRIGSVWLIDNAVFLQVPSLFVGTPRRVESLVARGNRVFSDEWDCFICDRADGWTVANNPIAPYRAPDD